MKFGFYTLGCKTNQYETQAMEQLFQEAGHEIGDFEGVCDGYIINTCSGTAVADKKNRAIIRRCRRENPKAVIGVCGCYTQHAPEAVRALGVDVIGGSANRKEFVRTVLTAAAKAYPCGETAAKRPLPPAFTRGVAKTGTSEPVFDGGSQESTAFTPPALVNAGGGAACGGNGTVVGMDNALSRREFEVLPAGGLHERTRAMLKVQDGCVNFCSYCIIPYTRGPVRSAPLDLAVAQAKELAQKSYKEIIITGIEIASWGVDLPGKPPMSTMVAAICEAVPHLRVRLGSLEPRIITEGFCKEMAKFPNLCPQFHLSLQSGCDSVLARMKRKYDTARYLESVRLLRTYFPGCAVTTDMIVAFPGETEEEFLQSLEFIKTCGFADMHIFPYSRRPGTPADKMPGQLHNATKEDRSRRAMAVAGEMNLAYRKSLIGTTQEVLFEEKSGEFYTGHAPNYMKIYAKGDALHNQIRTVKITGLYQDGLLAKL